MKRRRVTILTGVIGVIAILLSCCLALEIRGRVLAPWMVHTYEDRMQDAIAAKVWVSETGQAEVVVTDDELNAAFQSLPSFGGMYPSAFVFSFTRLGQLRVLWSSRFDFPIGPLSGGNTYKLTVQDGNVRFEGLGFFSSDGSPGAWGLALETGINRAIAETGYRAVAVQAGDGKLTIDLEPVA